LIIPSVDITNLTGTVEPWIKQRNLMSCLLLMDVDYKFRVLSKYSCPHDRLHPKVCVQGHLTSLSFGKVIISRKRRKMKS